MAHSNIYIRKENEERWGSITDKSDWVNSRLLDTSTVKKLTPLKNPLVKKPLVSKSLAIPGVVPASTLACSGEHYMTRADCGRLNCPWS